MTRIATILCALVTATCTTTEPEPDAAPVDSADPAAKRCENYTASKRALFGELHSHTAFSFDARSYHNVLTPSDAYRFAKGEAVGLAPLDDAGAHTRSAQLDRPLDFVAVTDHGEFLGEIYHCTTPGAAGYESDECVAYRLPVSEGAFDFGVMLAEDDPERELDYCGGDLTKCMEGAKIRWKAMQDAAANANDRCAFTAFVAYEDTNTLGVSHEHARRQQPAPKRHLSRRCRDGAAGDTLRGALAPEAMEGARRAVHPGRDRLRCARPPA